MSYERQTASRCQKRQRKDLPCFVAIKIYSKAIRGLPTWHSGKESTCQCRRHRRYGFDQWVGRSPGRRNSNSLQYSDLRNPMARGGWQATVHRVAKEQDTAQQLNNNKAIESDSMVMIQGYWVDRKLWNRKKSPEIYPTICKNLIHNKCFTLSEKKNKINW